MLRLDRITIWLIIVGLITIIPAVQYTTSIDEFLSLCFLGIGIMDSIVNGRWRQYGFLWIILAIMTFYAAYSFIHVHFNIPKAIFMDFIVELKPFIPIAVLLVIKPEFNDTDRKLIKGISLFNCTILAIGLILGDTVTQFLVFHPTYSGIIIFISVLFYLYCSIRQDGGIDKRDIKTALIFLTAGLICMRAKYFGYYVFALYFLFLYKTGIMRHFNIKHALGLFALFILVIAVSWHKIQYYFLVGESGSFDPDVVQSFARPVLYLTGFQILFDYFPFGTGLASFATAASAQYYSDVYYEYGIDRVYGLAPDLDFNFICDTFFPVLAQFGVIGVVLFTYFWVWIYEFLRAMIRQDAPLLKYKFIIGSLITIFIMIESVAATTLTGSCGFIVMILLALTCIPGYEIRHKRALSSDCSTEQHKISTARIKIATTINHKRLKI